VFVCATAADRMYASGLFTPRREFEQMFLNFLKPKNENTAGALLKAFF
jgi:hypothetical protein